MSIFDFHSSQYDTQSENKYGKRFSFIKIRFPGNNIKIKFDKHE